MLSLILALGLFSPSYAKDSNALSYYPPELVRSISSGKLSDQTLVEALQKAIEKNHRSPGYDGARQHIFGELYVEESGNGHYVVHDVYCQKDYSGSGIGPGIRPKNATQVNTEHTWPQSKFNDAEDRGFQKADLFHLFPSDSEMNSNRGNYHFGEVVQEEADLKCSESKLGSAANGETVFEPPQVHKGNVARAIFYFAVRYKMKVDDQEEKALRKWDKEDPIDEAEATRAEEIHKIQGNRNPFIDMPGLVDQIQNL
jgi:deoxyribonuclease-1